MNKTENLFNLVPQPVSIKASDAYFIFQPQLTVFCPNEFQGEVAVFNEQLEASTPFKCRRTENKAEASIIIELTGGSCGSENGKVNSEAYKLTISECAVTISAKTAHGVFNALETLRQILMCCKTPNKGSPFAHYSMQCAEIEDCPRFEWRGFMLDCARTFFPVSFIKKLIDAAALHKLNHFHWHLTDDQGWRIPVAEYPKLIEIGSVAPDPRHQLRDYTPKKDAFYTHEQMKDVISYAAARHIMVVPEIEMPGHASAILASYPELGCTGGPYAVEGRWGIFDDVLCAGNDDALKLLEAAVKTVAEIFPAPFIHIGGDECPHVRWETCPKCQARIKAEKLDGVDQLQSWITSKMAAVVAKYGKTPIGWDEVLDGTENIALPQDLVVMSWRGAKGGIEASKRHHRVIMAPTDGGCYLDYPHLSDPAEPGLQSVTTVRKSYDYSPLPDALSEEEKLNILGGQGNLWSELLSSQKLAEYMLFPRLCALSEALWLDKKDKDFDSFSERLKVHKERLDMLNLLYYRGPLDE